jgi:peptidoglycan hydrolase CwlO-like protein
MPSYSSIFSEIITDGNFKNDFVSFWNMTTNTLHNDYMPTEVIQNSEDIAILKPQVTSIQDDVLSLQTNVQTLSNSINSASIYIQNLQVFFTNFKNSIYLEDGNNTEFNYNILMNGVPEITSGNSALENEVLEIQQYMTALKSFINTFKTNIYLSNESGEEMDYTNLL